MSRRLLLFSFLTASCLIFGCASVPEKYAKNPEFGSLVREANGRFLGCYGYSLEVPGVDDFMARFSPKKDVLPIPGTSDFWRSDAEFAFNQRAHQFAREYNTWLLSRK